MAIATYRRLFSLVARRPRMHLIRNDIPSTVAYTYFR